jgi:hypothetical protein
MDTMANVKKPSPIATDSQWSTKPPTKPGTYWLRRGPPSRDIMVQVRETNGEQTVWWPDKDQPVATLRASWHGPIPPSTGPGSR